MTTSETCQIQIELEKAKKKDINIEIECTIDISVNYLDVTIKNENGKLRTLVYRKPTAEPYYLPYTSDHPHKYHRNISYSALIRAARLCSHVHDFNIERLRIEMSLLLGQYPPNLISDQFLRFFQVHNAMSVYKQLDRHVYQRLHQQLIHKITEKEKKLINSMKDPVKYPAILQKKPWDRTVMYPRYLFQSGPVTIFSYQFHLWWKKHYQYPGSPVRNIKVRIIPKTNRTLAQFFIHKKPPRTMLRLPPQPTNQ
jgi:hypothetical protein